MILYRILSLDCTGPTVGCAVRGPSSTLRAWEAYAGLAEGYVARVSDSGEVPESAESQSIITNMETSEKIITYQNSVLIFRASFHLFPLVGWNSGEHMILYSSWRCSGIVAALHTSTCRSPLPRRKDEFRSRGGNHEIRWPRGSKTSSDSRSSCGGPLDQGVNLQKLSALMKFYYCTESEMKLWDKD